MKRDDPMESNWKQVKGRIQERWGDLTDDELERTEGRREEIASLIQEHYGLDMEDAEQEVDFYFEEE